MAFYIWGAHWRHLANSTEPFVCSGVAALCQITLTLVRVITGSECVHAGVVQGRSLLTKCLIIAMWGKLTLYKYVACWLIAVSLSLRLLFLFSRLHSGSARRSPLRIIVLGFYGLPVTQHCRQPGSVTTGRPLEMCVCQNNVSSTRAKTRPGPAQNHPQTTVQPSPTWNVA